VKAEIEVLQVYIYIYIYTHTLHVFCVFGSIPTLCDSFMLQPCEIIKW